MGFLKDINFQPVYFKSRNEVYKEFYKPAMEASIKYDRVSGYFGSSIFIVINDALKYFIQNKGHIRIVCSPVLSEEDIEAIKSGYSKCFEKKIESSLNDKFDEMMADYPKSSQLLSKLIEEGYLEIKLAVFGDNPQAYRLMHDKIGIFTDGVNNSVCFRGSINETFKGVSQFGNSESFDVDKSWGENIEKYRVNLAKDQFDNIWNGVENGITTFDIPDTSIEKIKSFKTDKTFAELLNEVQIEVSPINQSSLKINLPYKDFVLGEKINLNSLLSTSEKREVKWTFRGKNELKIDESNTIIFSNAGQYMLKVEVVGDQHLFDTAIIDVIKWAAEPGIDRRKIRPYQLEILDNWELNFRKGLFAMATGSGKTFTAMCAIRDAIYTKNEIPIIIVPRKILFSQWLKEIRKSFSSDVNVLLFGDNNNDLDQLNIMTYPSDLKVIILATIQMASKPEFIRTINQGNHLFMLIDEVHNVGSDKYSKILNISAGARIGLSATPKRYRDAEGTQKIFDYFGEIIKPQYTIIDAIRDGSLCKYYYFPEIVELTLSESSRYKEFTKMISKRYAQLKSLKYSNKEIFEDVNLKINLLLRADIVKKAHNKIELTMNILKKEYKRGNRWLIYCDDKDFLDQVKNGLLNLDNLMLTDLYEYHSDSDERSDTLIKFEKIGGILLSINCLDEGVDIPSIDHAIILSSSQNERQYIQRRGRVLRLSPETNKKYSKIFDAVVSPNQIESSEEYYPFLSYELKRAETFADHALNQIEAKSKLSILKILNLQSLIDEGEEVEKDE